MKPSIRRLVGWLCAIVALSSACDDSEPTVSDRDASETVRADAGAASPSADTTSKAEDEAPSYAPAEWAGDAWEPAEAPEPADRIDETPEADQLADRLESHFEGGTDERLHVQTDKPLYRPGETIWVKTWNLQARDWTGVERNPGLFYRLVAPDGEKMKQKRVRERGGHAANSFELPDDVEGGIYEIRVETMEDHVEKTRTVRVAHFEAPRIKKELEFTRDSYGPGDEVTATVSLKHGDDEPFANRGIRAGVRIEGRRIADFETTTNAEGGATFQFELPDDLETTRAIFGVKVGGRGNRESIVRPIPIVLESVDVEFFPEGGELVEGLPSRVYFAAEKPNGDPASIEGTVVDEQGREVATLESYERGMGRFELTPKKERTYRAKIETPSGETETVELPDAKPSGCVLRHYDDFDGRLSATRMGVQCTGSRRVVVSSFMRHNVLDVATVEVEADEPTAVYLEPDNEAVAAWQGVTRVTLFDSQLVPLAERLVYRRRQERLEIDIRPDRKKYEPRDEVELTVQTRGPSGALRPAHVAFSVVDDQVLSFADDDSPNILSSLLLQPELPGEIEEPNELFELDERKAGRTLDLLLGTRGYRTFEWKMTVEGGRARQHVPIRKSASGEPLPGWIKQTEAVDHPKGKKKRGALMDELEERPDVEREVHNRRIVRREAESSVAGGRLQAFGSDDSDVIGGGAGLRAPAPHRRRRWAKVREFPVPEYSGEREGPRHDFRDTVYWDPDVQTGPDGEATVSFPLSDAITSFRAVAEGAGAGLIGRGETVFESTPPFGMRTRLPLEVSADDRLEIPVTLMNERDRPTEGSLTASFGELLTPERDEPVETTFSLPPGERKTKYVTVEVTGTRGESKVKVEAESEGVSDAFERTVTVSPRGFPRRVARSGSLEGNVEHTVDVSSAYPGTTRGSVELYPNPVATMLDGVEGMLSKPHGCFEQVSSSNHPNVMLLRYVEESGMPAPGVASRARKYIGEAYGKLVGYETPEGGFSVFGRPPGNIALTAYGLLEFEAMDEVWSGVDSAVIDRTAQWLLERRDGQGGFERSEPSHGYGRTSKTVSDAYVAYSLAEAGRTDDIPEVIDSQVEVARNTDDPYVLALAANTLLNTDRSEVASKAARRLSGMQQSNGAWTGAEESITTSYGDDLSIETTALATMALIEAGSHRSDVRRAIRWLVQKRDSYGTWGGTQATVLTLQALSAYAESAGENRGEGAARLLVDGEQVVEVNWTAERAEPVELPLAPHLEGKAHTVTLERTKGDGPPMPYTLGVRYRTETPETPPEAPLTLETKLDRNQLEMGDSVRLEATVENTSDRTLGMTLVHVAIPGGLTTQEWSLEKLRERDAIAYVETRERSIMLYLHGMASKETKTFPVELKARFAGDYTGQALRAYPYYNEAHTSWTEPIEVGIER
jgi:hypothetical protein